MARKLFVEGLQDYRIAGSLSNKQAHIRLIWNKPTCKGLTLVYFLFISTNLIITAINDTVGVVIVAFPPGSSTKLGLLGPDFGRKIIHT